MPAIATPPSPLPVVAIVGRPNVGKSTLFNRMVRAHRAIVDDAPGVTRDRLVAEASHADRRFRCVDTGGFLADVPARAEALDARVRAQALRAIADADVIVCVLDGTAGYSPFDREMVRLLSARGTTVLVAINKIDGPRRDDLVAEFHRLGVAALHPISAAHGRGVAELLDAVVAALPTPVDAGAASPEGARLALIGRPNVGKSSLLNRLLGHERVVVSPLPGTTRDAIDTAVLVDGRPYVVIDTAGIRRRTRVDNRLERHGAVRALATIARADLVLVVLDATEGMTDQDARIVGRAWEAGRGVILVANKWDGVPREARNRAQFRAAVAQAYPAFAGLPVLCVSALTGDGLGGLFPLVARVERGYLGTFQTASVNRLLAEAVAAHAPPSPSGRPIRLLYATQTGHRPPEITVFASAPGRLPDAYTRYLEARYATAFRLVGVPLRVRYRARRPDVPSPPRGSARRARRSGSRSRAGGRPRPS